MIIADKLISVLYITVETVQFSSTVLIFYFSYFKGNKILQGCRI